MSYSSDIAGGLKVTTTVAEAASFILERSYAVYRVDEAAFEAVQQAWLQANNALFQPVVIKENDSTESIQSATEKYQVIQNGHLLGFHNPSAAKLLFRAYCHGRTDQPWPSPSFQKASCRLATELHELLEQCCAEIALQSSKSKTVVSAGTKRRRQQEESNESIDNNIGVATACATTPSNCPLDYFYYHGCANPAIASNCTAHVDRGYLVAICLGRVAGLEVLPSNSNESEYECPEELLQVSDKQDEQVQPCSNLVCILAGDQWRQLDAETMIKACVHRVRDNLDAPRLSMSYELRL